MKYTWYKLEKWYQGGKSEFQIRVPNVKLTKDDWDTLLEWIGDNTIGGHNYGYRIQETKLDKQSPSLKVQTYPAYILPQFEKCGKTITVKHKII